MRSELATYLILLAAVNLVGLIVLFCAGSLNWIYLAGCNILASVLIAGAFFQQRIDRGRPHYDQRTLRYRMQSMALWWGVALTAGMLIDLLLYMTAKWTGIFVATMAFAGLALLMTPLYLLGEWWVARRK